MIDFNLTAWEKRYGIVPDKQLDAGLRFVQVLQKAHERTGRRCVVLVDEYDKPLLDVLDTDVKLDANGQEYSLEDWNRDTLRAFYSVFKADGSDEVFPDKRIQRLQPAEGHQHGRALRCVVRHHAGGIGALFCGTDSHDGGRTGDTC